MAISFNGQTFPSGVVANKVTVSILPELSQKTVKISGRDGVHDYGTEVGTREIEVDITIKSSSFADLRNKINVLAEMLFTEESKPLIILDSPNRYYMAKLSGSTNLDSIYHHAQGTLKFVCSYPYSISTTQKNFEHKPTSSEEIVGFINNGSATVYPVMEYVFTKSTPYFHIATDKDILMFGSPRNAETQTPVNLRPYVLKDTMSSLTGWSNAPTVQRGVVQGTFASNGYSFSQANGDYGTGSSWHGASMSKGLSEPCQDFHMKTIVGLQCDNIQQMGKVEIYVRDTNGNFVGSVSMKDAWADGRFSQAEAFAGSTPFVQRFAEIKTAWQTFNEGVMELGRIGNTWWAYFAIRNSTTGVHHTQLYREWVDSGRTSMNPITSVQIHVAQLAENPVAPYLWVGDVGVQKIISTKPTSSQSPYIFNEGDVLRIDNEKALVTLNGKPCFDLLDPSSSFLKFKKGSNGVVVSDHTSISNGAVSFTERGL